MKKTIVALCALMVAVSGFAQGTIIFNNFTASFATPILDADGVGADERFVAQIFAGPDAANLVSISDPVPFFAVATTGNGFWNPGAFQQVTADNVAPGEDAMVNIKVWEAASGATMEEAMAAGGQWGSSEGNQGLFVVSTGGVIPGSPTKLPGELENLQTFQLTAVPEPSTIALALLGAAALFLRRRNK